MRSTAALGIGEMFGGLMTATEGTFALKPITGPTANGSLAAAHVYCDVVDLLWIEGARSAWSGSSRRPAGRWRIMGQCLRNASAET
ncbi:hypothetical protein QFZ66_000123 [Streptomyces sp. B4I13]|uniref:hypothetical protein n=1 Tax=Streptomyces sp. B4I13 TaxID=3042271 RepID=UPI00278B043B|nr:hypothetical protein [Streptomyces sp. B4I13]MDQ0956245.1 hypothetical protein [Streptomyces sp. B4I13]